MDRNITAGVMVAFLRTGRHVDQASAIVLLAGLLVCLPARSPLAALLLGATLLAAAIQKYHAIRVALDADLFELLDQQPAQTASFDAALALCSGRPLQTRSLAQRWQGACRLQRRQRTALLLECLCLAALLINA